MGIYTYPKPRICKEDIQGLFLIFDNGDAVGFSKEELSKITLRFSDRLCFFQNRICLSPAAGEVRLTPSDGSGVPEANGALIADGEAFRQDRGAYLLRRVAEDRVVALTVQNADGWSLTFPGQITACVRADRIALHYTSDEEPDDVAPFYVGGHCRRLKDGGLLLHFGRDAKQLWERFTEHAE